MAVSHFMLSPIAVKKKKNKTKTGDNSGSLNHDYMALKIMQVIPPTCNDQKKQIYSGRKKTRGEQRVRMGQGLATEGTRKGLYGVMTLF